MTSETPVKLRIPRQDLQDFDTFPLSVDAARGWARTLPMTSSSRVGQVLATAIGQLNRLELAPELRYGIMEELRSPLLVATASLSRQFLKQPLLMPRESRSMAELAATLYTVAGVAYTIVAVHTIQRRGSIAAVNPARLACEAIHRAIRTAGARLLQTLQLYRPMEPNGWLALHQLYALAEGQQLTGLNVEDELSGGGTISTAYLQALLLGACKPNTLRQGELAAVYRGLQEWGALAQVGQEALRDSVLLVNLDSDRALLRKQQQGAPPGAWTRYVDPEPLVRHLENQAAGADKRGVVFDRDTIVSPGLLNHLITAFGAGSMRNFTRSRSSKSLLVAVGLSACHYYLGGEQTFDQLLYGDDGGAAAADLLRATSFLEKSKVGDLWHQANPQRDHSENPRRTRENALAEEVHIDRQSLAKILPPDEQAPADLSHLRAHSAAIYDASPGGYCLEWDASLPATIKTGDVVCTRENESPRWTIACIRWISQYPDKKTLVGLELLSPGAEPYGARMQRQKKGDETEPVRVLLLPEISLVGQPQTLITPRTGFRERQKLVLCRQGEEFFVQLMRQVAATGSFGQFEFRYIKHLEEVLAEDKSRPRDTYFDSLWNNI